MAQDRSSNGGRSGDRNGDVLWLDRSLFIPLSVVVAKVQARQKNGRLHVGTGVTVAPGVILTNCHVSGDAEQITVSKRSGRWRAVAQHAVGKHDLCYLKVPKWRGNSIEIAGDGPPSIRQPVAALGYTGGIDMSFSEGKVSAVYAYQGSHLLQTTTGFSSGASGGALLDAKARLVGVLTFRLPGRSGHYYAVPANWVRNGMPRPVDWKPIGTPVANKPFWQGDISTLPYFMQVAPLQAHQRWEELLALTTRWAIAEPTSVEPWITRGHALRSMHRHDQAIEALTKANQLDPQHQQVLFELGRNQLSAGRQQGLGESLSRLEKLDIGLHGQLLQLKTEKDKQ